MPFKKDVFKAAKLELEEVTQKIKEAESTKAIIDKSLVDLRIKKGNLCTYVTVHEAINKKINS